MTDWTDPMTFVDGEVGTAAEMNTHLRDNLKYLKEHQPSTECVTMETERTTTSDSYTAVSGASVSVTLTATSNVRVMCTFQARTSDHLYPGKFKLYRDATAIGIEVQNATPDYAAGAVSALDADLAAGTYAFNLRFARAAAGGTIYCDQVTIIVAVEPVA